MKKILITAIDSFTGSYLAKKLENEGYEVFGTSLSVKSNQIYICDITNKSQVFDVIDKVSPDFIIHLSAVSFAAHKDLDAFYRVNVVGTTNVLDSLVELGIPLKKIILASSATVYGNQGIEVLDESLCPKPANHYGASKLSMECLASAYFDKLPIIITRPFNYTGIGQEDHFLLPKIVKHFREGQASIELGNLLVSREFNDIEYVSEIYKKLLLCDSQAEIVNIASNKSISLLEIIDIMNKISGYKIEVIVNPDFVRKNDIKTLTGSTEKLNSMIGSVGQVSVESLLSNMFKGI